MCDAAESEAASLRAKLEAKEGDYKILEVMGRRAADELASLRATVAGLREVAEAAHTVVDCHGHNGCSRCHPPLFDALVSAGIISLASAPLSEKGDGE